MTRSTCASPLLLTTALAGLLALAAQTACGQAEGGPTTIMLLGDSITESNTDHASYRYWLWKDLEAGLYAVDFVGPETNNYLGPPLYTDFDQDHAAYWGKRAEWLAEQLQTQGWATTYQPDVVQLIIGTNDLLVGQSVSSTLDDIRDIIDELRLGNPDVSVVLGQLYAMPILSGIPDANFVALNEGLVTIALEKDTPGSHIYVSDQRTGFDAAVDTFDGVHPDESGEQKIATRWQEVLLPILDGQPGAWTDVGGGTSGTSGPPVLSGSGPLTQGSVLRIQLTDAAPGAFSLLFISVASAPLPFLGGTLYTLPILEQDVIFTDGSGQFSGAAMVPSLPAGTDVWFQMGVQDLGVPGFGAALSNGLRMTTP